MAEKYQNRQKEQHCNICNKFVTFEFLQFAQKRFGENPQEKGKRTLQRLK